MEYGCNADDIRRVHYKGVTETCCIWAGEGDSRLRGNDSGMGMTKDVDKWIHTCVKKKIPACAGMTVERE